LTRNRSLQAVILVYLASTLLVWSVVFSSEKRFPVLYNPQDWDPRGLGLVLFGWQRTAALLLLPIGIAISWLTWNFLGYFFVMHAFIPYHKGSALAKIAPRFFKERLSQNYFVVKSEDSKENLKTIVRSSLLPFASLLSITILISRDILNNFPTFVKQPSFGLKRLILLSSSVFTNFTLFVILPILAFVAPSIWMLEGSGLRYYDPVKKEHD
jgi:hypothetical protein